MSHKLIRSLIEQRLYSWAAAKPVPVAWQNVPFDPPTTMHLRAHLMPSETGGLDLAGQHATYTGVYQVDVVAEAGKGSAAVESMAEEIAALFPNTLRLTSGAFALQVTTPCSIGPPIQSDRYMVPVWFRYRADA